MNTTATVHISSAKTVHITHPQSSYGIFCLNDAGDLFVNSDWGLFGYSWRSFGNNKPFTHFLASCSIDYIVDKLSIDYFNMTLKKIPPHKKKHLLVLVNIFIERIKTDIAGDEMWVKPAK